MGQDGRVCRQATQGQVPLRMGRRGTHNKTTTPKERKFRRRRSLTRMGEGAEFGRVEESQEEKAVFVRGLFPLSWSNITVPGLASLFEVDLLIV